jgi:hypothetical protein
MHRACVRENLTTTDFRAADKALRRDAESFARPFFDPFESIRRNQAYGELLQIES